MAATTTPMRQLMAQLDRALNKAHGRGFPRRVISRKEEFDGLVIVYRVAVPSKSHPDVDHIVTLRLDRRDGTVGHECDCWGHSHGMCHHVFCAIWGTGWTSALVMTERERSQTREKIRTLIS